MLPALKLFIYWLSILFQLTFHEENSWSIIKDEKLKSLLGTRWFRGGKKKKLATSPSTAAMSKTIIYKTNNCASHIIIYKWIQYKIEALPFFWGTRKKPWTQQRHLHDRNISFMPTVSHIYSISLEGKETLAFRILVSPRNCMQIDTYICNFL